QMVAVTVAQEQDVATLDGVGRAGARWVAEPGVEDDDLVARCPHLDTGVAVPGDGQIAVERHAWTPPGSMLQRGSPRPRGRPSDRPESRLRQLDRADGSGARHIRSDRAPSPPDHGDS